MKRKRTKTAAIIKAEQELETLLRKVGYKGGHKGSPYALPNLRVESQHKTSDRVPGNGSKRREHSYSGDEIMGIVTTHKSNLMPVRKDNKQSAIDAAQMRRN